jgi:hypothetical protein
MREVEEIGSGNKQEGEADGEGTKERRREKK